MEWTSKSGILGNISVLDLIKNGFKGLNLAQVTANYNTISIWCVRLDFKWKFVKKLNFLPSKTGISKAIYWRKKSADSPSFNYYQFWWLPWYSIFTTSSEGAFKAFRTCYVKRSKIEDFLTGYVFCMRNKQPRLMRFTQYVWTILYSAIGLEIEYSVQ